jgi:hypothetical protein
LPMRCLHSRPEYCHWRVFPPSRVLPCGLVGSVQTVLWCALVSRRCCIFARWPTLWCAIFAHHLYKLGITVVGHRSQKTEGQAQNKGTKHRAQNREGSEWSPFLRWTKKDISRIRGAFVKGNKMATNKKQPSPLHASEPEIITLCPPLGTHTPASSCGATANDGTCIFNFESLIFRSFSFRLFLRCSHRRQLNSSSTKPRQFASFAFFFFIIYFHYGCVHIYL